MMMTTTKQCSERSARPATALGDKRGGRGGEGEGESERERERKRDRRETAFNNSFIYGVSWKVLVVAWHCATDGPTI